MQQHDPLLAGAATIRGDLRDLMLRNLAGQTKLWKDMREAEQQTVVQQVDALCGALVTQIAVLTTTGGRPAVLATLERLSIDAECRATLTLSGEAAAQLICSRKQIVAIMQPGPVSFMGERAPAQTQPDQLDLIAAAPPAAPSPELLAAIDVLCGTSQERCVPERLETLQAQQQALIEGRRPCQMFPTGTPELPLPDGMERIKTERGVFHFNSDEMDAVSIVSASNAGEENLVLGLGPYSKAEIMRLAAEGEKAVCVVERAAGTGNEVLTALTVERFADEVKEVMEERAGDGNFVAFMAVEAVLQHRVEGQQIITIMPGGGTGVASPKAVEAILERAESSSPFAPATMAESAAAPFEPMSRARSKRKARAKKRRKPARTAAPRPNGHAPEPKKSVAPQPAKPTGSPFAK